ncbi:MAG TPA: hypothetical protein DCL54_00075 [Alphaproteobacteria bacterium]|nr:hypothetical protein [Alphaproteobacteria bacterium]HAJ44961.1 hypothetical protein [Alphaproteobacteria bacterium]
MQAAQDIWFQGNPLWLIGIGLVCLAAIWLLIRGAFAAERRDKRYGRSDLDEGGTVIDADDGGSNTRKH